jgi:CHASE2 domain-containing sensor protein
MRMSFLSKWAAIGAVIVLVAAQAFAVNYLGRNNYLPEGSDHWTEDWLIRYFSKRLDKPYKDVALVYVDAESLEKAGLPATVPVDRGWMAKLITAVAEQGPAAIGIDFYYTSAIDPVKDEQLAAAIRDAKSPIVVAAVKDSFLRTDSQRAYQRAFIERVKRPAGHIHLGRSKEIFTLGDRATRNLDHGPLDNGYTSLTSTLARLPSAVSLFGAKDIPDGQQRIDWLLGPKGGGEPFAHYSAHEILSPEGGGPAADLKNKIVFIGPNFAGMDQLNVPFSVGDEPTVYPGVFIHAQAMAQILDGRFFLNWSEEQQFLLLLVIGLTGAALAWVSSADIILGIGGTLLIIGLSVPFFMMHAPLPTALAILSWALSISISQRIWSWRESAKRPNDILSGSRV